MTNKLQTLKGFRDFLPEEKRRRDFVMGKIIKVFELYGYQPIETPALEYASLLLGKYGEDTDRLIYKFKDRGGRELALKFDQTVPSARIMGQYQSLPLPFKRYQIQPVWRAEKPQRGRYREFLQCDADIFGPKSYTADAEIITVFAKCYEALGIDYKIQINSREILFSILKGIVKKDEKLWLSILRTLDKLDKKTQSQINNELKQKSLSAQQIEDIFFRLKNIDISQDEWLKYVYQISTENFGLDKKRVEFTPQMTRGLDYYTGIIFEAKAKDETIGSLGGGGRYDKLIETLSGKKIKAVGFALGFDRIMEVVDIKVPQTATKVFIATIPEGNEEKGLNPYSFNLVTQLRQKGIATELNLDKDAELRRQIKYADLKKIPFVITIGPDEIKQNKVTLKDMKTRQQQTLPLEQVIKKLQSA